MAGYRGKSMSNNAAWAYATGEKPLSKWTKAALLAEIEEEAGAEILELVKGLTAKELKDEFLRRSSWHHTGAFYNATVFYELDIEKLEDLAKEDVEEIVSKRKPRARRDKSAIEAEKAAKEARRAEREKKEELEKLFRFQKKYGKKPYKTLKGFLRAVEDGRADTESLRKERAEAIEKKRAELLRVWTAQGFKNGLENAGKDDFIENYLVR